MVYETHYLVREANGSDVSAIAELVNRAFAVERFFKSGDRTDEAQVRELMQTGSFLLITDGQALTSCVCVKLNGERPTSVCSLSILPSRSRALVGA